LVVAISCRALPLTLVTDIDAISPQGAVRYGDSKHWFVFHDEHFGAARSGLGLASAAGGKYGGKKSGEAALSAIVFGPGHQHV